MKVSAKDVLRKMAQDPREFRAPVPSPDEERRLKKVRDEKDDAEIGDEASEEDDFELGDDDLEKPKLPTDEELKPEPEKDTVQSLTNSLLKDYFDDEKISDASEKMQKLIPLIGPDNAEKFIKIYTDWIKSTMAMKAHILSLVVLTTPQAVLQQRMQGLIESLQGGEKTPESLQIPIS